MSMMVSFVLSFFPRDVLDEILNLIESVSEDFPSYSTLSLKNHVIPRLEDRNLKFYRIRGEERKHAYHYMQYKESSEENPQKLTQLSSRSHPRHLVGNRTAQKDTIIDTTSDSQVNSNFPYR